MRIVKSLVRLADLLFVALGIASTGIIASHGATSLGMAAWIGYVAAIANGVSVAHWGHLSQHPVSTRWRRAAIRISLLLLHVGLVLAGLSAELHLPNWPWVSTYTVFAITTLIVTWWSLRQRVIDAESNTQLPWYFERPLT